VVIAIAIANDPDLLICDEPTTALDVTVQAQILDVLKTARDVTGAGVLIITHDLGVVAEFADRALVMYAGRAVETADVDVLYRDRQMPYTAGLLGSAPRLDAPQGARLVPIPGAPPSLAALPPGCPFAPRCPLAIDDCRAAEPDLIAGRPRAPRGVHPHRTRRRPECGRDLRRVHRTARTATWPPTRRWCCGCAIWRRRTR
jgi:oligopeptide/dipeptide ABC transporter ATP-binding protein